MFVIYNIFLVIMIVGVYSVINILTVDFVYKILYNKFSSNTTNSLTVYNIFII